jgi:uncharacterized hydrophobic protein (TIGR00271 family)
VRSVEPETRTAAAEVTTEAAAARRTARTSTKRKLRVAWSLGLRRVRILQDRLLCLLGASLEGRAALVAAMLHRNPNEATSYWLQLVVALGIATLGLVVGSVAVIIGAMLVAPLMGPIVALAMGLATGSPFLVLRSATRITWSVIAVTGGAALITLLLPFHELNEEIAARTSPTVLDLLTAGFCALAGVYASLRPGSDTATTAAGTSIGISLVPPLCASGYGFGTGAWPVAGGAALLFLTNLVAIIFVGMISFVAAGFNRVDVATLEREELARNQKAMITAAISRRLSILFESKAGPVLRFLMPLILLALVYAPLRRALDEVAWQVRVRAAVQDALRRERHEIVQSQVRVDHHEVELLVVLLGKTADAEASRTRLDAEIRKVSGVVPRIEIFAIPDAAALAGLESSLRTKHDRLVVPQLPAPTTMEQLENGRELIRSSVLRFWPSTTAGEPLVIDLGAGSGASLQVEVVHLGPPLGPAAVEGLGRSLGASLKRDVQLVDVAIPSLPLSRAGGDLPFVSAVTAGVRASAAVASVHVCVTEPAPPKGRKRYDRRNQELADSLQQVFATHPRVSTTSGPDWTVRFATQPCTEPHQPTETPHKTE